MKNFLTILGIITASLNFGQEKIYTDKEIDSLYIIIKDDAKKEFTEKQYKNNLKCLNKTFDLTLDKNFKIFHWARPSFENHYYYDCISKNWNKKSIKKWNKIIEEKIRKATNDY